MSANTAVYYNNEKHAKTQSRSMDFVFRFTAAKTIVPVPVGADCFTFFDAVTQAQIDAYLTSPTKTVANDFLVTLFDATAMGADTFGGIINMGGQAASVISLEAKCYSGTGGSTLVTRSVSAISTLTASTLETAVGISPAGNLAFKVDFGNTPDFDALTAGTIVISVKYISK